MLTPWNDNTVVTQVSAVNPFTLIMKATRCIAKEAQKKQVNQPFMVSQYIHFMRGMDSMDRNIDNYRMKVRSKKVVAVYCCLQLMLVFTTRGSCTRRLKITDLD